MSKEKKVKSDRPEQPLSERIKGHQYYLVLSVLLSILAILGYFYGAFGKIQALCNDINKIPAIDRKIEDLEPYKVEQKVMQENVRHLEKKLDSLEERFFDSLTKKTFEIDFKIFSDKAEEFLRSWPLKKEKAPPPGHFFLQPSSPLDTDLDKLKETYTLLQEKYQSFLDKNPEERKKIDGTFEALKKHYSAKLKETPTSFPEPQIKKQE